MPPRRDITIAAAAALAGAAGLVAFLTTKEKEPPAEAPRRTAETVCIETNLKLVEGMSRGCYTPAEFEAFRRSAVLGGDGEPAEAGLAPPSGTGKGIARTCVDYDSMIEKGWYALSARDMRHEEYFTRACGALSMLVKAEPATSSHFAGGGADESDIAAVARSGDFGFGETPTGVIADVRKIEEGVWRLKSPASEATIFEIAHADFTGDGLGEILAYVSIGASGGTARAGEIGLIEKPSAGGPIAFRAG